MATSFGFSPAGLALGLGGGGGLGSDLQNQVSEDTEELRKKKMLEAQQRALLGTGGFGGFGGFNGTGLVR
jgi:hypothetical protein